MHPARTRVVEAPPVWTTRSPTRSCAPAGSSRRRRCPVTSARCTARAGGRPTTSTATGGATTRSCAPPTASTAPAPARGRSTSRTASSPGSRSRPTTRRSDRTARSTSPAAAPVAPPSPGTPTPPPGCATRTSAACSWRCTAKPRLVPETRCSPGPTSSTTQSGLAATSGPAARAAWCAPPGTRRARSSRPLTSTRSSGSARTASPGSRRSPPCRWCRTPPERGSCR